MPSCSRQDGKVVGLRQKNISAACISDGKVLLKSFDLKIIEYRK